MDNVISPEFDKRRETFFRLLFRENEGYVCVAYATRSKVFREEYFHYPKQIPEMLNLINTVVLGHNVWFCPQLLDGPQRIKEHVVTTPVCWADLDTCEPSNLLVAPSITLESSPGRYQALWSFDTEVPVDTAEDLAKRIAYHHADSGADRSGWDLTQLLRVPYTYNYKYVQQPVVTVVEANRDRFGLDDFAEYPEVAGYSAADIPMPAEEDVPQDGNALLQENRLKLNPRIWQYYQEEPPLKGGKSTASEALWQLMMLLLEAGFKREQVFSITREAKCNKWERDGRGQEYLWRDIVRAYTKYEQNTSLILPASTKEKPLVTDEDIRWVESNDTFVERYMTWAKSLGDAAPQYHQAGAFIALSSLIAGHVRLPTSFGVLVPNLWFMILADTTLTRKSTAMDIAMELVMEIDDQVVLATDGSLEGLLTSLSTRPGMPSVFLRDEFSGLLEQMTKKDYMAGMPELLTKLYDGKMQKRVLRRETVEVRDPVLIVFAGGIKERITSLLSYEQVSSGFMPRFVFITAESDVTRVKPLGPPTQWIDDNKQSLMDELEDLVAHYKRDDIIEIQGEIFNNGTKKWAAELTPEAWHRYNVLEDSMLKMGMDSERPDIMTPTYDRLSKSMLKAAVLLSASRQRSDRIIVEEEDIVRAIVYGEHWKMHVRQVMASVGMSQNERQFDNILGAIKKHPGISRSKLMQSYHLSARDADHIFGTLEQRGVITRAKQGRTEVLYALG